MIGQISCTSPSFAYNNSVHTSTKVTPFYAYTGCNPRRSIIETPEWPTHPSVEDRLERLRRIRADLSTHLQQAQQTHKVYADRHRLPSSFKIGDRVLSVLSARLMMSPSVSIYLRNFGFIRCFIVLSSNPIKRTPSQDILPNLHPRSIFEDGPEYEVAGILDSRIISNKLYYLVDWLGYSPSERTWELFENVTNARALLDEFHRRHPDKPGPQSKPTRDTYRFKGGMVS
jgi:hypothetical protein